jgi:DNA (cytosine-5)-methyltransferase 1
MNYLSVCSGIEAATAAWHHMGWKPVGFSEIEKFPSLVLQHHYPSVTNYGDMTKYKEWSINEPIDLIVGGTPCQSFSVAGLRKGLEDPRGNLALTYVGLLDHFKPKWFIWENVPGVLSSNGGQDFSAFLSALAYIGYGFAFRVLDAQHFGVPQRRRRVFVVGHSGGWQHPAKILFEQGCLSRDFTKGRKKREETSSNTLPSVVGTLDTECGGGKLSHQTAVNGHLIPQFWNGLQVAETLTCTSNNQRMPDKNKFQAVIQQVYENHPSDSRVKEMGDVCQTVTSTWGMGGGNVPFVQQAVAIQDTSGRDKAQNGKGWNEEVSYTLDATGLQGVAKSMAVRRLTPTECERLQGFPDGYTDIMPNGKQTPDGPRYKALGNSMAVPVMRWIGERINKLVA